MIEIILTGGTIEKIYFPLNGSLGFGESCIPDFLRQARIAEKVTVTQVLMLDSLDMHDDHRKQVKLACEKSTASKIVVIHGTDTMTLTAQALGVFADKTIVFTGAMVPARIEKSDAFFNLGFALASVKLAASGIYIAMNGQLLSANQAMKNKELGIFQEINH